MRVWGNLWDEKERVKRKKLNIQLRKSPTGCFMEEDPEGKGGNEWGQITNRHGIGVH